VFVRAIQEEEEARVWKWTDDGVSQGPGQLHYDDGQRDRRSGHTGEGCSRTNHGKDAWIDLAAVKAGNAGEEDAVLGRL
jgi:hypothetical protein